MRMAVLPTETKMAIKAISSKTIMTNPIHDCTNRQKLARVKQKYSHT